MFTPKRLGRRLPYSSASYDHGGLPWPRRPEEENTFERRITCEPPRAGSVRLGRRVAGAVITTLVAVASTGLVARPASATTAISETAFIVGSIRSDGAIAVNEDLNAPVRPYLANYAAMGLARSGGPDALAAAWSWLHWYQAHEDVNTGYPVGKGYVTDYNVVNGVLTSTGTFDSTDAYAGTFLSAVCETFENAAKNATPDIRGLLALKPGVWGAIHAIQSTLDTDNLTWASPTSSGHVKYLMDEIETEQGLLAAADIGLYLNDDTLASTAMSLRTVMLTAIRSQMYNSSAGSYDWAIHGNGVHVNTDWSVFYPDAMENVWAATVFTATPVLATARQNHPHWDQPTASDIFVDAQAGNRVSEQVYYWPIMAVAMRIAHLENTANVASIRNAASAAGYAWPYTVGVAGELLLATTDPAPNVDVS
jgi:hypothetical protein